MEKLSEKDEEIFKVLLVHWINHNREHVEGYREWSKKIIGPMPKVSDEINAAAKSMEEAGKKLMEAKIKFQEN